MPSGTAADRGDRRRPRIPVPVLVAMALAAAMAAGCTSEDANPVGALVPGPIEPADPVVVTISSTSAAGNVAVRDDSLAFAEHEVLYLGERGGEKSSFMAIYDFSCFQDTFWQDTDFTEANVTTNLRLFMLEFYSELDPDDAKGLVKTYQVLELADSLDVGLYPGPEPATSTSLTIETEASGALVQFDVPNSALQRWLGGDHKGLLVREVAGGESQPGLVGFASADFDTLIHSGEIGLELSGTLVGPVLKMEFVAEDTTVVLLPTADVSTLETIDQPPASIEDGFLLRTHLRQCPYFEFDLSELPDAALINRAALFIATDSTLSYGPMISIVASEVPTSMLAGRDTVTLQELEESANTITGWTSVNPRTTGLIGLDLTGSVQRVVNDVVGEPISWLITAGEDFTGAYDLQSYDPDFYLGRFVMAGTAVDSLRPYLQITYSPFGSIEGEEP